MIRSRSEGNFRNLPRGFQALRFVCSRGTRPLQHTSQLPQTSAWRQPEPSGSIYHAEDASNIAVAAPHSLRDHRRSPHRARALQETQSLFLTLALTLTFLGLQSRLGDKTPTIWVYCPRNGTGVLKSAMQSIKLQIMAFVYSFITPRYLFKYPDIVAYVRSRYTYYEHIFHLPMLCPDGCQTTIDSSTAY